MINTSEILKTASARCRDCYRCVRACPVKAIGVKDNQAYIDPDRCILCGTCVKECPQNAKVYRNDIERVKSLLQDQRTIASVAPSFAGIYNGWKSSRLPAALRMLGFDRVEETSIGADVVAKVSMERINEPTCGGVCSACPAVVSYIEKYMSHNTDMLMDVCSPMIAHGKMVKQESPETRVVFIGPCIAKKGEALRPEFQGVIDAVLTFDELDQWFDEEGIDFNQCAESSFDGVGKTTAAKMFALPGGMLDTAGLNQTMQSASIIHTSGADNVKMLLDAAVESEEMEILEPLFCSGGCIGGPGISNEMNIFERRAAIMKYANQNPAYPPIVEYEELPDLATEYEAMGIPSTEVSMRDITACYEQTGKANPEMRLDCGACGYANCEENAIAVIQGMAEIEMCLPYMRRLAEQKTDKIIEHSPNGIVILDEDLTIVSMNSSFKKYFTCTNSIIGRQVSYLCSDTDYREILNGQTSHTESIIRCYGKEFHQLTYHLPMEKQLVGIYVDISEVKLSEVKLEAIKQRTLNQVQKLLNHQVEMAQKMTMFLGESTAEAEVLLEGLIHDDVSE